MEIILTHEQADFDALGAMLAAHLLDKSSKPILPNKLNRNLRKFVNLYGFELPFLEVQDIQGQPIKSITLVDTQSLVTLKGINSHTKIHVVDHHQEKSDLPPNWTKTIEKVGASTTIFIDLLRERNINFSMIQATMLLLGIYEDTGSLSYASTTVRDVKAVAFLLEKGANLRIAVEFLNPALSDDQRRLADRLLENAKNLTIHDKSVLISSADGQSMREEISSVAHKIRDLMDPDALFLLVRTSEGIRLIARSSTDDVNVGKIASLFGGGGHERAAAALIHVESSKELSESEQMALAIDRLVCELHNEIRNPLTVSKIMSKKPLLISTDTTLSEAETLMQHYGYEGYPVLKEGQVVGLLTRRSVDRARGHKLNLTAGSLMEAGNYSLTPDQPIDTVQDLMASTGWGQIPVIDPATKKIIGIVTRTDVLKNLIKKDKSRSKQVNYASLVEKALSPSRLALLKGIIETSIEQKMALYIVGGFVRDLILNMPSNDFDIVVEGDALTLGQALVHKYGGRVVSHRRFGTVKWQIKEIRTNLMGRFNCPADNYMELPETLDLISARTEFYEHPTALPVVERSSIKQDLHRRDFTINTLALRLDGSHFGELHDYWGGLNDIHEKQVKVLHSLSFVDDPTRLLRAVRFEQRFGFQIETRTLQLMSEARSMLKQVSGDRVRHELDLIMKESNPVQVLNRLKELELLQCIQADLQWSESWSAPMNKVLKEELDPVWKLPSRIGNIPLRIGLAYLVWLSFQGQQQARLIADRLRFSNGLLETIQDCSELWNKKKDLLDMSVSRFTDTLRKVPPYGIYALYCMNENTALQEKFLLFNTTWRNIEPISSGETLKLMGIPPSPQYAQILSELRSAWLDGMIKDSIEEQSYLDKLLQSS